VHGVQSGRQSKLRGISQPPKLMACFFNYNGLVSGTPRDVTEFFFVLPDVRNC
jgi:hypothetical protein